jgi:hypothetical protein
MRHYDVVKVSQRVSIDTTVIRDLLDERRSQHILAIKLFEMADIGEIGLVIAPQGHRDDVWEGDVKGEIQRLVNSGRLAESEQVSRVSEVTLLPLTVGHYMEGFDEAWEAVLAGWKTHEGKPPGDKDRWHVETHLLDTADIFITDDGPLLVMCRRLRGEHELTIRAMRLQEYLDSHTV